MATSIEVTIKYLSLDKKTGYWRYERRVPVHLRAGLGKSDWKYSLGKDKDEAELRAKALKSEHDRLAEKAATADGKEVWADYSNRQIDKRIKARIAEGKAIAAPSHDEQDADQFDSPFASRTDELWRNVPRVLALNETASVAEKLNQLSILQAMAFGDSKLIAPDEQTPFPRPTARADALQFDAHKAMLMGAIADLATSADDPSLHLQAMMERYIKSQKLRTQTARSYLQMTRKLIATFADEPEGGDRPLPFYTKARLQKHRDRLADTATIATGTVTKAFAPLKALWRWAAEEYEELSDLQFPPLRLPRPDKTVEETRWQAFTDTEIKQIGSLISAEWGVGSASRLTPERRAGFLMAVRVMLYTGLRPVEVFKLTAENYQDGVLHIRETKTAGRKLPLTDNLSDLPAFLQGGGFQAAQRSQKASKSKGVDSITIASTLRDNFRSIVHTHVSDDRKVLYSLKDTLVERLQRLEVGDDVIRAVIGHKGGQGKLRHYKTPLGDTERGRAVIKKALDKIKYW